MPGGLIWVLTGGSSIEVGARRLRIHWLSRSSSHRAAARTCTMHSAPSGRFQNFSVPCLSKSCRGLSTIGSQSTEEKSDGFGSRDRAKGRANNEEVPHRMDRRSVRAFDGRGGKRGTSGRQSAGTISAVQDGKWFVRPDWDISEIDISEVEEVAASPEPPSDDDPARLGATGLDSLRRAQLRRVCVTGSTHPAASLCGADRTSSSSSKGSSFESAQHQPDDMETWSFSRLSR